jgi:transcriptional regulator with XRE-family HTH domain
LEKIVKLKNWIDSKKLTGAGFAEMLGVSPAAVSRWLGGSRIPCMAQMQAIEELTKGKVKAQDWYK